MFTAHREAGLGLMLLAIGVFLSFATKNFLTSSNLFNVLKQMTMVTIIGIGQTFVIISGGIDLCVGYTMTLCSMIMAYLLLDGTPVVLAVTIGILCSVAVGLMNGLLVTKIKLPAFIVTLAMTNVVKGIILVMSKGYITSLSSQAIITLGQGSVGPVPVMVIIMAVLVAFFSFVLSQTVFGNKVKAVGGNEVAASLSGIDKDAVRMWVYVLSGLFCGIAGVIITGRLNGGNPNAAGTFDMDSIAAVIVGGTSLSGGSGTIPGMVLGALLMILIKNGLVLLRVNMYWQTVVIGLVIIVVCGLDSLSRNGKRT
jgi:ribose transport system permease protein